MIYDHKGTLTTILWDSVNEPEALLKGEWKLAANKDSAEEHWKRKSSKDWLGVSSVTELRSVLKNGYPSGVAKLEKITVGDLPEYIG
jgi:hypothetical protein